VIQYYFQAKFYDQNIEEYIYHSEPYLTLEGLAEDLLDSLDEIGVRIEAFQHNVYDYVNAEYLGDISGEERLEKIEQGKTGQNSFTKTMLREWMNMLIENSTVTVLFMTANIVKRPLREKYEPEENEAD